VLRSGEAFVTSILGLRLRVLGAMEGKYFITETMLGSGAFATVFKAIAQTDCLPVPVGHQVAIKKLDKARMEIKKVNRSQMEEEVKTQMAMHHPNIVKVYGAFEETSALCIVLELCMWGSLAERVQAFPVIEPESLKYIHDVASGVAYIHAQGVCHRDLKLENIFLTMDHVAKVADFGLAIRCTPDVLLRDPCGTLATQSPELLKGDGYNRPNDAWAVGVILAHMAGHHPWFKVGDNMAAVQYKIINGEPLLLWKGCALHLCLALMTKDPQSRMTVSQAVAAISEKGKDMGQHEQEATGGSGSRVKHVSQGVGGGKQPLTEAEKNVLLEFKPSVCTIADLWTAYCQKFPESSRRKDNVKRAWQELHQLSSETSKPQSSKKRSLCDQMSQTDVALPLLKRHKGGDTFFDWEQLDLEQGFSSLSIVAP